MSAIYAFFILAVGVLLIGTGLALVSIPTYRRVVYPAIAIGAALIYLALAWS